MRFVSTDNKDLSQHLHDCLLALRTQMQTGRELLYPGTITQDDDSD
jgi:hypothetical protein